MDRPSSPVPPPPPPAAPAPAMFQPPTAREEVVANAPNALLPGDNSTSAPTNAGMNDPPASKTPIFNREIPSSMSPRGVRLEKVVGITATHNSSFALNPQRNEVAYPAGRTVVLQDTVTGLQLFHFHAAKTVSAIAWSKDGNIIAIGERGHQPGIAIWKRDSHTRGAPSSDGASPPPEANTASKPKYKRIAHLSGHTFGVKCIAFDSSAKFLVSVGFKHDHRIIVWDWEKQTIDATRMTSTGGGSGNPLQHSGEIDIPNRSGQNAVDKAVNADTSVGNNPDNRKVAVAKFTKRIHNIRFLDDYDLDSTAATDAKEAKLDSDIKVDDVKNNQSTRAFVTVADEGVIEYWILKDAEVSSQNTTGVAALVPKAGSAPRAFHGSNFVDAGAAATGDLYTVTFDGNLCSFGKNGIMEKWVSLHSTAYSVAVGTDFIVVGCAGGLVRIFQARTLKYVGTLPLPAALTPAKDVSNVGGASKADDDAPLKLAYPAALCVNVNKADSLVTVMYANRQLTTWDVSSIGSSEPTIVNSHLFHSGCIWDVVIPAATATRMHCLSNGKEVHFGGTQEVNSSGLSTTSICDNAVITCSADGTIRFWDLEKKRSMRSRNENKNNDSGSSNSSSSSASESSIGDFLLHILYADATPSTLAPIPTSNSTITSSPKSTSVDTEGGLPLAGSSNERLAKMSYDAELPPKAKPNDGVRCIDVSPDGRWLASGDRQGRMRIHDLRDMSEFSNAKSHDAEVLSISFCPKPPPQAADASPTGSNSQPNSPAFNKPSLLASSGRDRLVKIYDVSKKFENCDTLDNHSASVLGVKFALDGSRLLTCGGDRTIVISRVKTLAKGQKNESLHHDKQGVSYDVVRDRSVTVPYGTIYDMNVHENNRWIVTAGSEKKVQVWSLFSGKRLRSWKPTDGRTGVGPDVELYKIKLDATGTYAATCSFDKQVRIYDFISGSCVARFSGHSELVTGVAFTADCRRLISVGGDGCIFVWRLPSAMTRAMRERREAKKVAAQRKRKDEADELKRRAGTEKQNEEIIVKSPRKHIVPSDSVQREDADSDKNCNEKEPLAKPAAVPITDEEIFDSVSKSIRAVQDLPSRSEHVVEERNLSPPKSSKTNKMGEEATDNNLMVVGKAMTRHPQQTRTGTTAEARPIQTTISTVGSTIASTSDLPTWAQTEGSSSTTQNQIAATQELPGWAKTQTEEPRKRVIAAGAVAEAHVTAINGADPIPVKESVATVDHDIDDSGDSSATELGDENMAAPLANAESEEENVKTDGADVDSPPRPINTRSLAEERRALALRQRGQEASAAVADMRARLSALGILADTPEKLVSRDENEDAEKDVVIKETLDDVVERVNENLESDMPDHNLSNSASENKIISLDTNKVAKPEKSSDTSKTTDFDKSSDTKKAVSSQSNEHSIQPENSKSLAVETSKMLMVKSPIKKDNKSPLLPPTSSTSPKRRESKKRFDGNMDSNCTDMARARLSKPAEAYRASLANLREALSHCVEMYKEVDFVRQSLPSAPERSGVEALLQEFQKEFKGIMSEIPQEEKNYEASENAHEADGEEDSESDEYSSSEDESELEMLLSLAKKLNKKKKRKKMLRSSGKLKRRTSGGKG